MWWSQNLLADLLPWLHAIMASVFARALVVGIGLLTFAGGMAEIWKLFTRRWNDTASEPPHDWSRPAL